MTKPTKNLPFWKLNLNPITMKRPVLYYGEEFTGAFKTEVNPELSKKINTANPPSGIYDL